MYVLLVEDDRLLAETVAGILQQQGWRVDVSARGEPVPASVLREHYDALVVDIGLPGIDGLQTLAKVREQGSVLPVIMLTARDTIEERVRGLEAGADDYLVKPFAPSELIARLRAITRRHEMRRSETLVLAALRFDQRGRQALIDGRRIWLSARECIVLQHMLLKTGQIVGREEIESVVPGWSPGTTDNAMASLMSRLRAKIEPGGVRLRTVRGLGYLLEPAADH
jgi:DNA-binding response OmpR family regulator